MPSTFVNNLRLEEIATGEKSGTWGDVTNVNLEAIAQAFGRGTEDLSSDANATITLQDGVLDDARSFSLKITSSASLTATREVTLAPNTVSKVWVIENATTGSQSITIKQGSGTTVTIPSGDSAMIATDGGGASANVVDILSSLKMGDIDVTTITASGAVSVGALTAASLALTADLPISEGGTGSSTAADARVALGLGTAATQASTAFEAADSDILKADTSDNLTAGFTSDVHNAGTKTSGTFTPSFADSNYQRFVLGGAVTLGVPTTNGTCVVLMTNNSSAGTLTTSSYTKVDGDDLTTTNGHDFFLYITRMTNGSANFSSLTVKALQ